MVMNILVGLLVLALGVAAAHFGWQLLTRMARGEADDVDYLTADASIVAFLLGCAVIALAAVGLFYGLLWLVGWA